ncbi:hypothetical protein M1N04_01425 [Peptococcaceae bacterium]|nr:hypothetical protein [Peptococcaceae bacterium]
MGKCLDEVGICFLFAPNLINAALGLVCVGIVDDMKSGMEVAAQSIDSGAAMKKLNELVEFTKVVC